MNWKWVLNMLVLSSSPASIPLLNALLFTPGLTFSSACFEVGVFLAVMDVNNPIPARNKLLMEKTLCHTYTGYEIIQLYFTQAAPTTVIH